MTRFLVKLAVFTLLALVVVEVSLRITLGRRAAWYSLASRTVETMPVNYIFVGSSRVAASIDENCFEQVLSERLGRKVKALNMGMGFATLADHYFGLRKLLRTNPRNLEGVTVLIEAPLGLPFSETWGDRWVIPGGSPDLLVPYASFSDLSSYWRLSSDHLSEKLYITASKCLMTVRKGGAIRDKLLMDGDRLSNALLEKAGLYSTQATAADLSAAGGIRTDENQIRFVRQAAVKNSENEMRDQHPIRSWNESVLRSIVELVTAQGGSVVLFDLPLNNLQRKPLNTELRKTDRLVFRRFAQAWAIPILETSFTAEDSDYPDFWHLRRSLAAGFTTAIARAYLDYLDSSKVPLKTATVFSRVCSRPSCM